MIFYKKNDFFSIFYFDPGVIWGGFRHPKSIFRYLKIEILWKHWFFLTPKSICLIKKKEPEPEPNKKQNKKEAKTKKKSKSNNRCVNKQIDFGGKLFLDDLIKYKIHDNKK